MEVKVVGVVGAGQVGTPIAAALLLHDRTVVLRTRSEATLQKARVGIDASLERRVARGDLTPAQKEETLERLITTTNLSDLKDVDLVVEVVPEDIEVKKDVFAKLDAICSQKTILTTSTTSIPVTPMAAATKRPDRCAKMHFWYPATAVRYIEIARGYLTSDETWETVKTLCKETGRNPIKIVRDYHGVGDSYLNIEWPKGDPYWDLMMGKTTLEELEAAPKGKTPEGFDQIFNFMEMRDFVGMDTTLGRLEAGVQEYGTGHIAPLLRRMVEAGHLGQKTGIGFYDYSESPRKAIPGKFSPYLVKFLAKDDEFVT